MDILSTTKTSETIRVRVEGDMCFVQIYRPEANNTINDRLIQEITTVLELCEDSVKIVILEGLPHVFCVGADFKEIQKRLDGEGAAAKDLPAQNPEPLYDLWSRLASGPYITVAHVRGKVNAGGIGFVAACDVAICGQQSVFSLSELLFGLMPACVLPFLIRRIGFSKANHMCVTTQPISAQQAKDWGLVDACESDSEDLLRKILLRLSRLSKTGVSRYKRYMSSFDDLVTTSRSKAIQANLEVFSDRSNLEKIARYVETGQFPWEAERA